MPPSQMYGTPPSVLNENPKSERTKLPLGDTVIHSVDAPSGEMVAGFDDE